MQTKQYRLAGSQLFNLEENYKGNMPPLIWKRWRVFRFNDMLFEMRTSSGLAKGTDRYLLGFMLQGNNVVIITIIERGMNK